MSKLRDRLAGLSAERLRGIGRGIEKESLRAQPDGALALTPHPAALGAPLTHPHITTDYSESLIELVTGVHQGVPACLQELTQIHQVVHHEMAAIGEESPRCPQARRRRASAEYRDPCSRRAEKADRSC